MKAVASYGIVNADTSGPGAFLRAAKWYWDELTDMFAAAGVSFNCTVFGVNRKIAKKLRPRLPVSVHPLFVERDGFTTVFFEVDQEEVEKE